MTPPSPSDKGLREEVALLPCPFCGGDARLWPQSVGRVVLGCAAGKHRCQTQPHIYAEERDAPAAIEAWNRRAPALPALSREGWSAEWTPGPFTSAYDVRDKRVLILASYCGGDNPHCTDERPCNECLAMDNVALVRGRIRVLGGLDYVSALSASPLPSGMGGSSRGLPEDQAQATGTHIPSLGQNASGAPPLLDACERAEMWLGAHPEGREMQLVLRDAIEAARRDTAERG